MRLLKKITSSRFIYSLLEVNDVSFKYYIQIFLILSFFEISIKGNFILRSFGFSLNNIFWFLLASTIAKIIFNLEEIKAWFKKIQNPSSKNKSSTVKAQSQEIKKNATNISNYLFEFILVLYLAILLIKEFKVSFMPESLLKILESKKLSNLLLGLILIGGITHVIYGKQNEVLNKKEKKRDWNKWINYFIFNLGVISMFMIFFKIKDLGSISYYVSAMAGILFILLSIIILKEDE